jgi:rod shape-determining protein MreC
MVMDKRMESFASVRAALTLPITPLQYLIHWPTQVIDNLRVVISTHDNLVNQNLKLKSEQLLLRSELQRLIAIESENNYLKSLMKSSKQLKYKTLIAELLAVDSEPYVRQVVLDKGARDGVYIGQPVLDASGVMGQVAQVGQLTSRVILVNDPHSGVAVQNARSGMRTVAVGDSYSGKIRLMYVPKTADIHEGDLFVTSGLGDQYPGGYPVGKVAAVTNDPAKQFLEAYLQPSARLDSSREVLLVWYQKHA